MIAARDKVTFQSRGLIFRKDFLPSEKVARARQAVLDHLEKKGVRRNGDWRLDALPPSTQPNAGASLIAELKQCEEIVGLIGEETKQAVAEFLDGEKTFSTADTQILFTLPNATTWTVPHSLWHLDLPRLPDERVPGVQIFTFLDTVLPEGGGTLVVAGSHRLVRENRRISSQQAKKIMKRERYFRDLMSPEVTDRRRFLTEPEYLNDLELQVIELCGEPGDAYFTDLRLLHTIAPNATTRPRIMATQRFLRESLRQAIYG